MATVVDQINSNQAKSSHINTKQVHWNYYYVVHVATQLAAAAAAATALKGSLLLSAS